MRALLAVATIAAASLASSVARAGSAIVIPPLEVDTGLGAPITGGAALVGPTSEVLAGLHWASLAWRPTHIDIGVGFVGLESSVRAGYGIRGGSDLVQSSSTAGGDSLSMYGGYLELAKTLRSSRHWRTWLSARGELLHGSVGDDEFSALGAVMRVQSEVYVAGVLGGNGGAVCGTAAIGIYAEAAYRDIAPELGPGAVSTGITLRVPFLVAGG